MHYHRWYRHGTVEKVATNLSTVRRVGKYKITELPNHPVAAPCGKAYVHRVVLYDAIGGGAHPCHWCQMPVTWDLPSTDPLGLQVDHLNNTRDDNRIENLVPSCLDCNVGRGAKRRHEALVADGYWSNNDTVAKLKAGRRTSAAHA